jgi:hypothetical protein
MTLTQGRMLDYDLVTMSFGFTMVDGHGRIVDCSISGAAMDELDTRSKGKGTMPKDRASQFALLRPRIEALASAMFDLDNSGRMTVRIYYHHIWSRTYRAMASSQPDAHNAAPSTPALHGTDRTTLYRPRVDKK